MTTRQWWRYGAGTHEYDHEDYDRQGDYYRQDVALGGQAGEDGSMSEHLANNPYTQKWRGVGRKGLGG